MRTEQSFCIFTIFKPKPKEKTSGSLLIVLRRWFLCCFVVVVFVFFLFFVCLFLLFFFFFFFFFFVFFFCFFCLFVCFCMALWLLLAAGLSSWFVLAPRL